MKKAFKAAAGIVGNGGGVLAGGIMMTAPTVVTQVFGTYLVVDGSYGVVNSFLQFSEAVGWRKEHVPENTNSLPRLVADRIAPGKEDAPHAADAVSLTSGLIGGKLVVTPLMFSTSMTSAVRNWSNAAFATRSIAATSNWPKAAESGMNGFSAYQARDGFNSAYP